MKRLKAKGPEYTADSKFFGGSRDDSRLRGGSRDSELDGGCPCNDSRLRGGNNCGSHLDVKTEWMKVGYGKKPKPKPIASSHSKPKPKPKDSKGGLKKKSLKKVSFKTTKKRAGTKKKSTIKKRTVSKKKSSVKKVKRGKGVGKVVGDVINVATKVAPVVGAVASLIRAFGGAPNEQVKALKAELTRLKRTYNLQLSNYLAMEKESVIRNNNLNMKDAQTRKQMSQYMAQKKKDVTNDLELRKLQSEAQVYSQFINTRN